MSTASNANAKDAPSSTNSNDSTESTVPGHASLSTDERANTGEYTEAYTTAIAGGGGSKHATKKKMASRRSSKKRKVRIDDKAQTLVKGGATTANAPAKKSKRENPLMKTKYTLSDELRRVLHDTAFSESLTLSRPEVVKGIWEHIKQNELQTEVNGKRDHIKLTGPLKGLFPRHEKHIQMFTMNKELSQHLVKVQA